MSLIRVILDPDRIRLTAQPRADTDGRVIQICELNAPEKVKPVSTYKRDVYLRGKHVKDRH